MATGSEGMGTAMSEFLAVTTFNAIGLEKYGRRMMNSFVRFWPEQVPLWVFNEGWRELGGWSLVPLETASDWLPHFKARHAARRTDNYRLDAVRFSHKIAALIAADELMSRRFLLWIDGDTVTHSRLTLTDLINLAPTRGEWIAWLDRSHAYPECGFYIIDRDHPRHQEMMTRLREMYDGDKLFLEKEWHDSYILQQVVLQAGVTAKSLSGTGYRTHHPFVNGPLGQWMDHMKGARKVKGKSPPIDLKVKRREEYWRTA